MKKAFVLLISLLVIVVLSGCTGSASADVLKSDKDRVISPVINTPDLNALVDGNNAFAMNLYGLLKDKDGNLFYSPYSISQALAMTYGGAAGETETQMADAMQFRLPQSQLHSTFNFFDQELAKRGQGAKGKDEKGFRLNIVNAIWGQKDFSFQSQYLDLLAQNYGAGLRVLDYIKDPEGSRQTINNWVSQQTEDKIKNLIPSGAINTLTRLVLTNAIYFNAAWQAPFEKDFTVDGTFNLLDGKKVTVPMMKQTKTFAYASGTNYQVVELPYDGGELSMVVIMPGASQFKSIESTLSGEKLDAILSGLKSNYVILSMPKFKIESEFSLKDALSELGMPLAFTDQADFSGMDGKKDLYISSVVHKAFVAVDEAGTEAAAATAVIVGTTSMPTNQVTLTIDQPFIFLIRDITTGTVLFIGRVMNPAA